MATKIEWCDETWNPITGCTPISEGCERCYAKRMANRLQGRFGYPDAPHQFDVTFHPERLNIPAQRKKPTTYFVNSMSDTFHADVDWNALFSIFQMCGMLPRHKFLFLTKRPNKMHREMTGDMGGVHFHIKRQDWFKEWPLPNLWLGVTAENQKRADERIPILLQIPAAVRFVSVEPMLGPVDLANFIKHPSMPEKAVKPFSNPIEYIPLIGLDWVIAGPETGPKARPCDPKWIRDLYEQCKAAGVPFFDKRSEPLARKFPG